MNYILLHWSYGRKSMERVLESMTEPCDILAKRKSGEWWTYTFEEKEWKPLPRIMNILEGAFNGENKIINWGNRIFANDSYFAVNLPSAVARASDKKAARGILMSQAVAIPPTNLFGGVFMVRPQDFPLILRPRFHHGGQNFNVIESYEEFEGFMSDKDLEEWYASKIFPKTHEYRVHCAHGKILLINEKPLVEGEIRANHVVNQETWRALKWSEFHPKVCEESLKATEVLGLDYSAVDVMYNEADDSVAICEVNTSPSVTTDYSSAKYAAYFSWLIRHNFPLHFHRDGKSVFYNKILEI